MWPRLIILGSSALLVAWPAGAQEVTAQVPAPPAASANAASEPTPSMLSRAQIDRLRADVGTFEIVLERAISKAGLELSQWADQIVPGVPLVPAAMPVARGVPVGDGSIAFHLEVPEMLGVPIAIAVLQRPQAAATGSQQAAANGAPIQRVGATGAQIVQPDPTTGPPHSVTTDQFDKQYSDYVREAVIDAMLDQSGMLTLKDNEMLSVAVIPVSVTAVPSKGMSRDLVLSIKGADLALLREGKISREEAKRRMIETRF